MSRPHRGPKGSGCIVRRRDGKWQFSIDVERDGRRRRIYIYASSRTELQRKIADERARSGGDFRPRAQGTLGEWMERWLENDVKPNRAPNTYALYRGVWQRHARPIIGNTRLERLDVQHVERLYAELRTRGVGDAVLHRTSVVLSCALQVAIRRRIYFQQNPFTVVDKPRYRAKEMRVLTVEESRAFVNALFGDEYAMLWLVLISAGLRLGEALGLEWRDVDFERGTLAIRQSVTEVNGVARVAALKTHSSRRMVQIGPRVVAALQAHKRRAFERGLSSTFVFVNANGGHPSRANLRQRHLHRICREAGVPQVTIHALRHTMASLGILGGVQPKVLSERLGHSTVRLTQDRYAHILPGVQEAAAETLDGLLFGVDRL